MSGFKVNFSVNNQLATPSIHAAALANRPAAGQVGRVFIDSDNPSTGIYRDTGTAWVVIGMPSSPEADTLQTVTNRGNTTTQSITVGAATVPVATVDVRRTTASLNGASDWAIASVNSPTIPAGASFGVNFVNAVNGSQALTFAGNATIGNTGLNSAGMFINTLGSSGAGTVTVGQSTTIRTLAAIHSGVYFNTAAATTFSHVANIKTIVPINSGAAAATVTNYYGVLVSDSTPSSGTVNFTNRYGVYQEGTSDVNFFAGNVNVGTGSNVNINNFTGTAVGSLRVKADTGGYGISVQGTSGTDVTQYNSRGIVLPDGSGNNATIESVGSSGLFRFTSPIYQFRVTSGLTNGIYISSAGNINFGGTSDSGQKVQVNGTFRSFGTSTTQFVIEGNNPSNPALTVNGSTSSTTIYTITSQNFSTGTAGDTRFNGSSVMFYNSAKIYGYQQITEFRKQYPAIGGNIGFFFDNDTQGTPPAASAYKINQFKFSTAEVAFITGEGSFSGSGFGTFGTLTANASAILQADSTTKGFLPPRMTDAQITAITTPATGLMAYSTTQNCPAFYDGTGWRKVSHSPL